MEKKGILGQPPRVRVLLLILICVAGLIPFRHKIRALLYRDTYTVAQRLEQYGAQAANRLMPYFKKKAGVEYPPAWMGLVAIKETRRLELWVAQEDGQRVLLRTYPILAASGGSGPKLKEGDYQVPEGIYKVESLNPNSLYHLSLRVNYPNDYDKQKATEEKRSNLGGDIMIHGSQVSIGCLAMGDEAIEEIFILAGKLWPANIPIIISPVDFRTGQMLKNKRNPVHWGPELYSHIRSSLEQFPVSKN